MTLRIGCWSSKSRPAVDGQTIDPKLGLHRLNKPKITITDRLVGLKETVESYQKRIFEFFHGIKGNQYGGVEARAKLAFAYRG
jgi:hypothetical protein